MGLIRFILIFFVLYLIIRFITRTLFPFLFINKTKNDRHKKSTKKEGSITINYIEKKDKESQQDDDGEYIDYEEIK